MWATAEEAGERRHTSDTRSAEAVRCLVSAHHCYFNGPLLIVVYLPLLGEPPSTLAHTQYVSVTASTKPLKGVCTPVGCGHGKDQESSLMFLSVSSPLSYILSIVLAEGLTQHTKKFSVSV